MSEEKVGLARFLKPGRENAVHLKEFAQRVGMDTRTLRECITAERLAGVPILSDNQSGYYLPNCDADVSGFCKSMWHRSEEIRRVADAVHTGWLYATD